jgi:hypothetical protein
MRGCRSGSATASSKMWPPASLLAEGHEAVAVDCPCWITCDLPCLAVRVGDVLPTKAATLQRNEVDAEERIDCETIESRIEEPNPTSR